jgi:5-formyltetrahydrofolate cyclo-ligase
MLTPSAARRLGREARRDLPARTRRRASVQLCRRLMRTPWYRHARVIAVYFALPEEACLDDLVQAAIIEGKTVLAPVIGTDGAMSLHALRPDMTLRRNRFGIAEPLRSTRRNTNVDWRGRCLVCAPMTAFDAHFNRVGMGGGHYDRLFARTEHLPGVMRIGVAFECQRVARIAAKAWDAPVDGIVTNARIYRSHMRGP